MKSAKYYGLVLAGGRGTRFWPRSRKRFAKQVLTIWGDRSMIQATVDRLQPLIPPERIWVITNEYLRDEIIRQLPEVPKRQIIAEPAQRNTAPAIGLAAHILHSLDADAVMGVFPADHIVLKPARYRQFLRPAFRAAQQGRIAVLGIQPRWVETGYGYVEFTSGAPTGATTTNVLSFREKPGESLAREYVASGRFFWNSGMFFWRAQTLLEELRKHLPKTASLLASLPAFRSSRFHACLREVFPLCESISIDFAVLEKADRVVGVRCDDIGWNDVGSWNAVYELSARDTSGNVLPAGALALESSGNYVDARGKTVALLGVGNLIVVDTPDALLVADRARAQDVGRIVKMLEDQKREDLL